MTDRHVSWGSTTSQVEITQEEWWDGRWRSVEEAGGEEKPPSTTEQKRLKSEASLMETKAHSSWATLGRGQGSSGKKKAPAWDGEAVVIASDHCEPTHHFQRKEQLAIINYMKCVMPA